MNQPTKSLTDNEIFRRRQLALDLVHLPTQELFDRSILNLQLFVLLPDHLIAEVRQAFETAQTRESNTSNLQYTAVFNPYLKRPKVNDTPFTRASGEYKSSDESKRRKESSNTVSQTGPGRKR